MMLRDCIRGVGWGDVLFEVAHADDATRLHSWSGMRWRSLRSCTRRWCYATTNAGVTLAACFFYIHIYIYIYNIHGFTIYIWILILFYFQVYIYIYGNRYHCIYIFIDIDMTLYTCFPCSMADGFDIQRQEARSRSCLQRGGAQVEVAGGSIELRAAPAAAREIAQQWRIVFPGWFGNALLRVRFEHQVCCLCDRLSLSA